MMAQLLLHKYLWSSYGSNHDSIRDSTRFEAIFADSSNSRIIRAPILSLEIWILFFFGEISQVILKEQQV